MVGSQFGMGGERPVSSYAVFALSGLVLWQIFWDSVTMPQWVTRRLRRLLSEARFSYQAILVAATSYVLFNGSLYLLLIVGTMLISRTPLPSTAVLGLLAIPGIVLSGLAIGMFFVPFTFVYLDFRYGLPMVSPVLLWTAPIFYESPDSGFLHVLNTWNPLTYLVAIPRSWLTEGFVGNDIGFVLSLIVFGLIFVPAHRFYNRAIPIGVERVAHA
jgi:lipopolysaccharide transport system permease protein